MRGGADRESPTTAAETQGHREALDVFFLSVSVFCRESLAKKVMCPAAVEKARSDWNSVKVSIAPGAVRPVY